MSISDEKFEELLKVDPFSEAEKRTRKSYKEDDETMSIAFAMSTLHANAKKEALEERGDTTYRMSFDAYRSVVEDIGFQQIRSLSFRKYSERDGYTNESYCLYYRDGWMLAIDSFQGMRNSANLFGVAYGPWDKMRGSSSPVDGIECDGDNVCRTLCMDVREALIYKLSGLNGVEALPWPSISFDADFMLTPEERYIISPEELYNASSSYEYRIKDEERERRIRSIMATFPDEVRAFIATPEDHYQKVH